MKKMLFIFVMVGLFLPITGFATGLGIFIPTWGSGNATVNIGDYDYDYEYDVSHFGFGFVMDTRVARRGVFNYRLNIGYESVDYGFGSDEKFGRISLDNTFGFGVLQTQVVRLWIGPQIRLAYMRYTYEYTAGKTEINLIGLGLSPVFGANFNIGSVISICPEVGYRFEFYGGEARQDYDYNYYTDSSTDDYVSLNRELFVKLSIIFRISDVFDDFY